MISHADPASAEVQAAAEAASVEVPDLLAAMDSTGIGDPWTYLRGVGELPSLPQPVVRSAAPPASGASSRTAECIIARESGGNPHAVNSRSGAAGLGQFLPGTWASTPQGRAGLSVFDPAANRAAVQWMISVGRIREFVTSWGC